MDYYDWVASQLGKAPTVTDWKEIPNEAVSDPNLTTHAGTMRQTWVGDKVVLTRVVVKPNSRGKPHYHPAEQVSMIVRGGVRVYMNGAERTRMTSARMMRDTAAIEAMKMENILFAQQDCVVDEIVANKGESLAVDQVIMKFR